MNRSMVQTALVWAAMVALCVVGTIHEYPNAFAGLRRFRNVGATLDRSVTSLVPDRLVAQDPEAGAILRYVLSHRYGDPNVPELRDLVAEHPHNEFFLGELTEALMDLDPEETQEALTRIDTLQALDPNNAHVRYLRAWVLLESPEPKDRLNEVLMEFEQADQLPEFTLPYGKYKNRVAHLAGQAALPSGDRPWRHPWPYIYFGSRITRMPNRYHIDRLWLRRLLASASTMADRVMDSAYGLESLRIGARLMGEVERTRLQELDLTEAEARQARQRLAQSIAIDGLPYREHLATSFTGMTLSVIVGWLSVGALFIATALAIFKRGKPWPAMQLKSERLARGIPGLFTLIGLLLILLLYRWRCTGFGVSTVLIFAWYAVWLPWLGHSVGPLHLSAVDAANPERCPWRSRTAYALLWLNGALILLMSNSKFFASGRLTKWSPHMAVFVIWSVFCLLAWLSARRPRVDYQWPQRSLMLAAFPCWAFALVAFNFFAGQRAYETHLWANPLSVYEPIPAATQQTYERYIRDSSPLSDSQEIYGAHALPEHIRYFTAEDMEAFLTRRQAEGTALSQKQLRSVLWRSARDVRPVLRAAIDNLAGPQPPAEPIDETETEEREDR